MNKITLLFFTFLLSVNFSFSQSCPDTNYSFSDQNALNNFPQNCTEIEGNIQLIGSDITDLSPLVNITKVGGILRIANTGLDNNLNGLENLNTIGNNLIIEENDALLTMEQLENVHTIGGDLKIYGNDLLSSLPNNTVLNEIGGSFELSFNSSLISSDGFNNLTNIGGYIYFYENHAMEE